MRDIAIDFTRPGGAVIQWSTEVTGPWLLIQKLMNNVVTGSGTDKFVPDRGTELLKNTVSGSVYDIQSARHELNFAALAAKNTVTAYVETSTPESEQVDKFLLAYDSVVDGRIQSLASLQTVDGQIIGTVQDVS